MDHRRNSRRARIAAALALVATLLVAVAPTTADASSPTNAAPQWVMGRMGVTLNTEANAWVNATSCVSASFCVAGGTFETAQGYQALVSVWNGERWTDTELAASLNTGGDAAISYVSCVSPLFCVAGGFYWSGYKLYQPFVSWWNGHTWTLQELASSLNIGNYGYLGGVSCASATFCVAAGYYTDAAYHYQAFVSTWNGQDWSDQERAASLNTGGSAYFNSVSCTSASFCVAGGVYNANGSQALISEWNGQSWTDQEIEGVQNVGNGADVSSVSCAARFCAAYGSYNDGSASRSFVGVLSGTTWLTQDADGLLGAQSLTYAGLSCSSEKSCLMWGSYQDAAGHRQALLSSWNGNGWTVFSRAVALNVGNNAAFLDASCGSPSYCVAVGYVHPNSQVTEARPLQSVWNGKVWSDALVTSSTGGWTTSNADAYADSCVGTFCVVGGYYDLAKGSQILIAMSKAQQPAIVLSPSRATGRVGHRWRLAVKGGAGQGAVTLRVSGRSCVLRGRTLSATRATTCVVEARKGASGIFWAVSSKPARFVVTA